MSASILTSGWTKALRACAWISILALGAPRAARAQHEGARQSCPNPGHPATAILGDAGSEALRLGELDGTASLRTLAFRTRRSELSSTLCGWTPDLPTGRDQARAVELLPVRTSATVNTAYPLDRNNGLRWAGRGLSTDASLGLRGALGPFSFALAPEVTFQENRSFDLGPSRSLGDDPLAYPWHGGNIDWPMRMGNRAFVDVGPGQSYLRADLGRIGMGFSTENLWWGPATRYPIILSNTAPGFPHASLETSAPIDVFGTGALVAQGVAGILEESEFFNTDPSDDDRFFSGFTLAFRPGADGPLTLGVSSVREYALSGLRSIRPHMLFDPLGIPVSPTAENNAGNVNGLGSLFFRLVLRPAGFELYGEAAREDFFLDVHDLLGEPGHSMGWMGGAQKLVDRGDHKLRLGIELVNLGLAHSTLTGRTRPVFYAHSGVRQGHTERGQLLGAFVGPGSDAQYLTFDRFDARGRLGFFLERVRWDDDAYVVYKAPVYGLRGHDVETSAGARAARRVRGLQLEGQLELSRRRNRNFVDLDGVNWNMKTETNVSLDLSATYWTF